MHASAMLRMKWFVDNYVPHWKPVTVLDVGSYNVNGSFKSLFDGMQVTYTGLDMNAGPNVDYVPEDPYIWKELDDESFDFIISGNAFEHIEFPWLTIEEMYRKLKENGFACILTPFSLGEHRYPVDCYRYLPDGMIALAKWAGFRVVESTVGGIPHDLRADPKWLNCNANHDDTMIVLTKCNPEKDLSGLPRMNYSRMMHSWT